MDNLENEMAPEPVPSEDTNSDTLRSETTIDETEEVLEEIKGKASTQKVIIENAIVKVEQIKNKKDLLKLANELISLPVTNPKEYTELLVSNQEAMRVLHDRLQEKGKTQSLTEEDVLTIGAIQRNAAALGIADTQLETLEELSRDNSDWKLYKGNLRLSRPSIANQSSGIKLTGAQARGQLRSAVGLSNNFWIPLMNSGFWINIEAPNEYDLVKLIQRIGEEKTALGTDSSGGVFSNSSCFIRRHVVDLLSEKIISSSIKTDNDQPRALKGPEIIRHILIEDYPDILTRFMALRYSKGFQFIHTCSNYTKPCNASYVMTLNLHNLTAHDFSRLSEEQEQFMMKARDPASVIAGEESQERTEGSPITTVTQYQQAFKYHQFKTLKLTERVDLVFRVPTIVQTVVEGEVWMNEIKRDIDKLIADNEGLSDEQIDKNIGELIQASGTRRYSQWVESAKIYNVIALDNGDIIRDNTQEPNTVDSRKDIHSFIADIVDDEELIERFIEGYNQFIAKSSMTVTGYPQFECKECGSFQGTYEERDKKTFTRAIIPFDGEENFFTLLQG